MLIDLLGELNMLQQLDVLILRLFSSTLMVEVEGKSWKYSLTRPSALYMGTTAKVQEKNATLGESSKRVDKIRTQHTNQRRLNNPGNIKG